ncbi:threonine synthase [Aliarcobacter butzleri]|uniref:threonine synthase n=1 Tax=Aliarcobacter butzleri TaxID=28197 RepID=UPI001EDE9114|nr:threonine synthase [Aliarcobacter butzleri]MCG3694602.1 threonine synthase [Aliarcobacter butzleri]MDN5073978.1 threonine synthase [Aliarcobacter butzleri]MDN5122166.1 threonine synthase [Aliarcobacter butzleri]MDN5129471.1 threonine synthase [Aliarcobacter butzleri]
MYVSHLECPKCNSKFNHKELNQLCTSCQSPLLVRYDLKAVKENFKKESLSSRSFNLWRYKELLPIEDEKNIVSLGEVITPLIKLEKLEKKLGLKNLYLKDEGLNPGGSFKSRGAAVGVSKAKELNVKAFAMPTNGNAGAAWSIYAARADIKAYIVMPQDAPTITRNECVISGAELFLVDGLISDAGKIVAKAINKYKFMDASTLKEPYRIEGKKTMGFEIAEQFSWELPDVILYPTGGGVGLIGIYKALLELKEIGFIKGKLPRLVAVQATNCAPIVKAYERKQKESIFWDNANTVAFGITVPKVIGDFLVLEAIYETNGCAIAISDEDILKYQKLIAKEEGLFICPEGAATLAATEKLYKIGWIKKDEKVVLLNTGSGLKYPDTVKSNPPLLKIDEEIDLEKNI